MSRLTICADDFALSSGISRTIAALAERGKINATSCMTVCDGWRRDSALLRHLPRRFQVGLHLTLTEEKPLSSAPALARQERMPTIESLTRAAFLGTLPMWEIEQEISAQFDSFQDAMGRPPDFVDGHQHAHVLPGIRQRVLEATALHAPEAWLRDCTDTLMAMAARPWRGKAVGSAIHSMGFRAAARRQGLQTNRGFAGHYDFAARYIELFPAFLRRPGPGHLVMCHPGAGRLAGDPIAAAREAEFAALARLDVQNLAALQGLAFDI